MVTEFIISFALLKVYCGGDFKMCMYIHLNYAKNAQKMHQVVNNGLLGIVGFWVFFLFLTVFQFFIFSIVTINYIIIKKLRRGKFTKICVKQGQKKDILI